MPEDVVLLHGFTQTRASWARVIAELGERYKPLALDLPGHGSAADGRRATFAEVIAALDAAIAARVVLGGYSMGGRVALAYAVARPERVRRLVLVGASPGIADAGERAARRAADEALARRIEAEGLEAFARWWGDQPLFAGQSPAVRALAGADRRRNRPEGLAAALRGLGTGVMEPLWGALPALEVPVTLVVGERDAKFRRMAEEMAALLPRARLVVAPGAGHAVHLEAPGAVAGAIALGEGGRAAGAAEG